MELEKQISTEIMEKGVIQVTILLPGYPMVAEHWRQQLTGRNAAKWGRIFIDPAPGAKEERRSIALATFGRCIEEKKAIISMNVAELCLSGKHKNLAHV
jgi:hypothetical protein